MKVTDINPYLRYASIISHKPVNEYMYAQDYHFYYMLSSDIRVKIDDKEYLTNRSTVIIIPPGVRYMFMCEDYVETISINFDYTQEFSCIGALYPMTEKEFLKKNIIKRVCFEDFTALNDVIVADNMQHIADTINTITEEMKYKKQLYASVTSSCFKSVIIEVLRFVMAGKSGNENVDRVLGYIHSHYGEDIDNDMLATIAGYHPYHLNRLMKKLTGETLHKYIINYRISVAKKYLAETDMSISCISEKCGYANFSNFSYDFKRKTGISASEYRKNTRHMI